MNNDFQMPQSVQAEQSVIGGLMLLNQYDRGHEGSKVVEMLEPSHFFTTQHKILVGAIKQLQAQGKPLDVITVTECLEQAGELEQAGGFAYLAEIASNTPSAANIKAYCDIVIDRAIARQIVTEAQNLIATAAGIGGSSLPVAEVLEQGKRALEQIEIRGGADEFKGMGVAAAEWVDRYEQALNDIGNGIETGLHHLDERVSRLSRGHLITIATRPSGGKSLLAGHITHYTAIRHRKPTLFLSLEMPAGEVFERMLSRDAMISPQAFKDGMDRDESASLERSMPMVKAAPLEIIDKPMTPAQIIQAIREAKYRNPELSLVVLDHLLKVRWPGKNPRRDVEIGELTGALKDLAKELNLVILLLTQLNRGVKSRAKDDKRPILTDLRDSSSIEDDSDLILLMHCEKNHDPDTPLKNLTEIIIAKCRYNPDANGTLYADIIPGGYRPVDTAEAASRIEAAKKTDNNQARGGSDEF